MTSLFKNNLKHEFLIDELFCRFSAGSWETQVNAKRTRIEAEKNSSNGNFVICKTCYLTKFKAQISDRWPFFANVLLKVGWLFEETQKELINKSFHSIYCKTLSLAISVPSFNEFLKNRKSSLRRFFAILQIHYKRWLNVRKFFILAQIKQRYS